MIPRLKGVIAHGHDTKLPGEDGEDAAIDWGTRPSPKAKLFEEDLRDILTHDWGNKPNPEKDPTPTGIKVQGRHNNQLGNGGKVRSTLIPPKRN